MSSQSAPRPGNNWTLIVSKFSLVIVIIVFDSVGGVPLQPGHPYFFSIMFLPLIILWEHTCKNY